MASLYDGFEVLKMWTMSALMSVDPRLLGCALVLVLLWWLSTRRRTGLPPGPGPALPLLGHLHLMKKNAMEQFQIWRRQYGDVLSVYMGGRLVVVVSGHSAIKEALVKFTDRPHIFVFRIMGDFNGIVSSSGTIWKEQRKASLEILRLLGMGKNVLAVKIQEEINHYIRAIEDYHGETADLNSLTTSTVSNNICSIVFGKRFEYDDPDFKHSLSLLEDNHAVLTGTALYNFFPILEHIPGDLFNMKSLLARTKALEQFVDKMLADHTEEGVEEAADFIDAYRQVIRSRQSEGKANTNLDENTMQKCIVDLFVAGTDTITATLRWALLFFIHHPEVQDKCYKEICDVIGPNQTPTMYHRQEMTYLEATTLELLRKSDIVPFGGFRGLTSDVTFRGYTIPKDTIVIPNLTSVHRDPHVWGDPDNFRPERFIGPDGKLQREEEVVSFSIGRRSCIGKSLAQMELFLYLSNLIQRFQFLPLDDGPLPSLEPIFGIILNPAHYKIRAVPRK